jgi:hypothetical protein
MVLLPERQIAKRGYRLVRDAVPILYKHVEKPVEKNIALYDLQSQGVKVDEHAIIKDSPQRAQRSQS